MTPLQDNRSKKMMPLLYSFFLLLSPQKASLFSRLFKVKNPSPLLIDDMRSEKK